MTGVVLGIAAAGIYIIGKWDTPLDLGIKGYMLILAAAILEGRIIGYLTEGEIGYSRVLLSVLGGSLLLASVTDILICQIYNFTWWPGMAALIWSGLCRLSGIEKACGGVVGEIVPGGTIESLIFFWLLQFFLFRHMYGRADCYAFCICAAAEAAMGMEMAGFLAHMLAAYVFLFPVQAIRRNINKRGNLKHPVPFLPYITASFWLLLILDKRLAFKPFQLLNSL